MGLIDAMVNAARTTFGTNGHRAPVVLTSANWHEHPIETYQLLRRLAGGSNVYEGLAAAGVQLGLHVEAAVALRNPTNAVIQFYKATVFPGTIQRDNEHSALPIERPERWRERNQKRAEAFDDAVHRVWRDSHFGVKKQALIGGGAKVADQVLKIVWTNERERLFIQLIQPESLTDFRQDERGFLTYIRLDTRTDIDPDGARVEPYVWTEVWDKYSGRMRIWRHRNRPWSVPLDELGRADEDEDIAAFVGDDFIPFVLYKHEEDDEHARGIAAVGHALDKIIYGDLLVTSLHQRLSNHNVPDIVIERALDSEDVMDEGALVAGGGDIVRVEGVGLWKLPPGYSLKHTVANLNYAAHLEVVEKHYKALHETDLPELTWGRISEGASESGKALRYRLIPAMAKVDEVRGNVETALVRANQMALSIGQAKNLPGFRKSDIGTYADGDFDHWFRTREIIPETPEERSLIETQRVQRIKTRTDADMSLFAALRDEGYSEEDALAALAVNPAVENGVQQ
jgi:hypothetical protein